MMDLVQLRHFGNEEVAAVFEGAVLVASCLISLKLSENSATRISG
jgi:hypothetical protein